MQKMKKSIDFFTKSSIVKLTGRSQKFAKLAESTNICMVFENERTWKSYSLKQKSVNNFFYRDRTGEAQENNIGFEQKGWKNLCVPTIVNF